MVKTFVDVLSDQLCILSIRSVWPFCEVPCATIKETFPDQLNVLLCCASISYGSNDSNQCVQEITLDLVNVMHASLSRFVLEEESTWRRHLWKSYQLSHVHQVRMTSPHDHSAKPPLQLFQSIFPRSGQCFLVLCKCLNWQQWFQSVCTRIHTRPWWCCPFITFKVVLDEERTRWRYLWTSLDFSSPHVHQVYMIILSSLLWNR